MVIQMEHKEKKYIVKLEGRIDTTTAPQFAEALDTLDGIEELVLDFQGVEYISSAGIRVILSTYKTMCHQGSMKLIHVNDVVYEALLITGFTEKLAIERSREEK